MATGIRERVIRGVVRTLELIGKYGFYDDMGISLQCGMHVPIASGQSDPIGSYVTRGIGDIEEFLSSLPRP
jgi:hypothetical protein